MTSRVKSLANQGRFMEDVDVKPLTSFALGAAATLVALGLFVLFRRSLARDLVKGNTAQRLVAAGQVAAAFLIAANAVESVARGVALGHDALWVFIFTAAGVVLVAVTGALGVRLVLHASLPAEVARGNVAAGLAGGAHFVATGVITSRAMAGEGARELALSVVFFLLGQVTLHVFVALFRVLTTYDDAEQIAGENLAAALSYTGVTLGLSIIIARATEGDFEGWVPSLKGYAGLLASVLVLYPVRQLFVQSLLLRAWPKLRGGPIDDGIAVEHSAGLGALEAVTYVATALTIARLA